MFTAGRRGCEWDRARAICDSCPVTDICLAWVLVAELGVAISMRFGFTGGQSPAERRQTERALGWPQVRANLGTELAAWPGKAERHGLVACAAGDCPTEFRPSRAGHRFCSRQCRDRVSERRRYQERPEVAEVRRAKRRDYYKRYGDYERQRQRLYDRERSRCEREVA